MVQDVDLPKPSRSASEVQMTTDEEQVIQEVVAVDNVEVSHFEQRISERNLRRRAAHRGISLPLSASV
jgi:hypothetical protein